MTREEAIGILNETQVVYFAPNGKKKVKEALDMAIEALSAERIKICDVVDRCEECPKYGDDCDGEEDEDEDIRSSERADQAHGR